MKLKESLEGFWVRNDMAWTRVVQWKGEKWMNLEYVSEVALIGISGVLDAGS